MKKHAFRLFLAAALLFYLAAFLLPSSRSAFSALGSVFLLLGVITNFRSKANRE